MVSNSFIKRFRKLDAYAKTLDDFRIRTATGGAVTIISAVIIFFLVSFETIRYFTPEMHTEIVVDGGKMEKLPIEFDIRFPHIPCFMLSLDIMDESGEHISEYDHDVYKERLGQDGQPINKEKATDLRNKAAQLAIANNGNMPENYCGSCYGANPTGDANPCCNSCEDIQSAYSALGWNFNPDDFEQCVREGWKEKQEAQAREGCRMHGKVAVNKLRGNFHFSAGKAFVHGGSHIHDMSSFISNPYNQNFMHEIYHLQFGSHEYNVHKQTRTKTSDIVNPLDDTKWGIANPSMMYQYFLKIVPTQFEFLNGKQSRTFQYSVSKQEQEAGFNGGLPGVFFMLDHSPMLVVYSETRPTFGSFLTSVCAIIGGVFSVASIIDNILYRISKQKKQM